MPRISHYEPDGTRVLVSEELYDSDDDDDDSLTSLSSLDDCSLDKENDNFNRNICDRNGTTTISTTSTGRSTNVKRNEWGAAQELLLPPPLVAERIDHRPKHKQKLVVAAAAAATTTARGTTSTSTSDPNKKLLPKKLESHLGVPKGGGYWKMNSNNNSSTINSIGNNLPVDNNTEAKDRALAMEMALAKDSSRTIYDSVKMGQRRRRVRVAQNTANNNFDPMVTTTTTTTTSRTKRGRKKRGRIQKKRGKKKRGHTRNNKSIDDTSMDTEKEAGACRNLWKPGDWCFITPR